MRVLSVLILLCVCVLGVSGQYTLNETSTFAGWVLTGFAGTNPTLTFTANNTYNFTVSQGVDTAHPFAFSSQQNSGSNTISAIDKTIYNITSNCTGTGTTGDGYKGANCVIWIAIAANATNTTIYYKCTIHPAMTGSINIVALAAANGGTTSTGGSSTGGSTAGSSTGSSTGGNTNGTIVSSTGGSSTGGSSSGGSTGTTPTPPTTGATILGSTVSNTFHVTGNSPTVTAYYITAGSVVYANPTLQVTAGSLITISLDYNNSYFHPFALSANNSTDTINATQLYFPDALNTWTVTTASACDTTYSTTAKTVRVSNTTNAATTPCIITIQTQTNQIGATLYYRCAKHPKMIGAINIVAASSSGGSSGGSTGSGSSSSTGGNGNSASTITISGLTFIVAIIAAIMA